ncbi:MAG TPA: MerR family transcriptional regulator [Chitinophagales bacterium]|nr:MerR family transcriptional regulator [Chitinophagales bacterium]
MGQYSIKEVETLSGVKAHTLRIWEQRYDFLKPERTDTNIRYYNDEQLKLILNISTLSRSGLRISKIACMAEDELRREVQRLSTDCCEPNALADAFLQSMIDFDEARFEKTLSCSIMKLGFERTISELIFPLLSRTGVLWATGAIKPAQEHFMSNLVRRKICSAIDNQYVQLSDKSKTFVLFLPEGEVHELVLLYTEYLLRQRNHKVVYIGNSVPFDDLPSLCQSIQPDYLVSYFSMPISEMPLDEYLQKLSALFKEHKILVGGKLFDTYPQFQLPVNITRVKCINTLLHAINEASLAN